MATLIQQVVEQILEQHSLLDAFRNSQSFHLSIENQPWMLLVIERQGEQISVAHYGEPVEGDAMRDPEICYNCFTWQPLWIQQDPVSHFAQVYFERDGKEYVNARLLNELKQFSAMWARNLREQGFTDRDRVKVKSLTHAQLLASGTQCE
jgi:hypothetical protein